MVRFSSGLALSLWHAVVLSSLPGPGAASAPAAGAPSSSHAVALMRRDRPGRSQRAGRRGRQLAVAAEEHSSVLLDTSAAGVEGGRAAEACAPAGQIRRSCIVAGDPHIIPFDAENEGQALINVPMIGNNVSSGKAWWLVKSQDGSVSIQARYGVVNECCQATTAVAVGGSFIQGHTLEISSDTWPRVTWDGTEMLDGDVSKLLGSVHVSYSERRRTRTLRLPRGISIQMQGKPSAGLSPVIITMSQLQDSNRCLVRQCGHCGNNDGVSADEGGLYSNQTGMLTRQNRELVDSGQLSQCEADVMPGEAAFKNTTYIDSTTQFPDGLPNCTGSRFDQALGICTNSFAGRESDAFFKAYFNMCLWDECMGPGKGTSGALAGDSLYTQEFFVEAVESKASPCCPEGSRLASHRRRSIGCSLSTCDAAECCEERGACSSQAAQLCTGGLVKRPASTGDIYCKFATCTRSECCTPVDECQDSYCIEHAPSAANATSSQGRFELCRDCTPKFHRRRGQGRIRCAGAVCLADECCVSRGECTDDVCTPNTTAKFVVRQHRRRRVYCQSSTCALDECCDPAPTPTPTPRPTPAPQLVSPTNDSNNMSNIAANATEFAGNMTKNMTKAKAGSGNKTDNSSAGNATNASGATSADNGGEKPAGMLPGGVNASAKRTSKTITTTMTTTATITTLTRTLTKTTTATRTMTSTTRIAQEDAKPG